MALVKHGRVESDPWVRIENDSLPLGRPLLVTWAEWQRLATTLRTWDQPLGLILSGGDSLEEVRPYLDRFQVIALDFPKFTDGRAYSQARLLRKRYGYRGELRAVGYVLQDQFLHLHRCGFDSVEVADERAAEAFVKATARYSAFYQTAERGRRRESAHDDFLPSVALVGEQPAAASWAY